MTRTAGRVLRVAALSMVIGTAGCAPGPTRIDAGSAPSVASSAPGPAGHDAGPSPTDVAPSASRTTGSALDQLQGFLQQVDVLDGDLAQAATLVNGDITTSGVRVRPATRRAVEALHEGQRALPGTIPAGLDATLSTAVLTVFQLVTDRARAFDVLPAAPFAATDSSEFGQLRRCLGVGAPALARFPAALARLRAAAAAAPAFTPAAPASRAAAELAVSARWLSQGEECGISAAPGTVPPLKLPKIVWQNTDGTAGTIDGVRFTASYAAASGWTVDIHAG